MKGCLDCKSDKKDNGGKKGLEAPKASKKKTAKKKAKKL